MIYYFHNTTIKERRNFKYKKNIKIYNFDINEEDLSNENENSEIENSC